MINLCRETQQEKLLKLSNIALTSSYAVTFECELLVEIWNEELGNDCANISDDGSYADIDSKFAECIGV